MPRSLGLLLEDMLEHSRIARKLAEPGFDHYIQSIETRLAIERCLQIAGEAMDNAVRLNPDISWRITDARKIIGARHVLTHHYYKISPFIVWAILQTGLPQLEREILAMQASKKDFGEDE